MQTLPTLILRHRKENRKKCSLTALEKNPNFFFVEYPNDSLKIDFSSYLLLSLEGTLLSEQDQKKGLCLIDGSWRLAAKMQRRLLSLYPIELRTLPSSSTTAYPRKQTHCSDASRGLASIEALYIAFKILGKETSLLLDHYYWREDFLQKNPF